MQKFVNEIIKKEKNEKTYLINNEFRLEPILLPRVLLRADAFASLLK